MSIAHDEMILGESVQLEPDCEKLLSVKMSGSDTELHTVANMILTDDMHQVGDSAMK